MPPKQQIPFVFVHWLWSSWIYSSTLYSLFTPAYDISALYLEKILNESYGSLQSLKDIGNNFVAILPDAWTDWMKAATLHCTASGSSKQGTWETTQWAALLISASGDQMLQCRYYNAQLQHLIKKKKKKEKDLLSQLVLSFFFFFSKGNLVPEKDLEVPAIGRELTHSILHDTSNSQAPTQAAKGTN